MKLYEIYPCNHIKTCTCCGLSPASSYYINIVDDTMEYLCDDCLNQIYTDDDINDYYNFERVKTNVSGKLL